jgi:PAS domain S-box-containing protein
MLEAQIRERLESALARAEEAEARYSALAEQLHAITYTEELDSGRITSFSPQVESILGYTPELWMGDPNLWIDRIHPDDRDRVVEECVVANRSREPFRSEYRMSARDGRILWIRDEAMLVRGSRGQPLCWQGVMLDITSQRADDGIPE